MGNGRVAMAPQVLPEKFLIFPIKKFLPQTSLLSSPCSAFCKHDCFKPNWICDPVHAVAPVNSCTSTMSWYWGGNKWLGGERASGTTWAAKKTTHGTMASGKHGISLDMYRTWRLEGILSIKQPKVFKRQRGPPRKESHKNLSKERYFR